MTTATVQSRSISTTSSTLKTSTTGFDKIDLRLIDWQILPGHELQIHHKGNQKQNTLLFYLKDQPVFGYGAHYRTNWWYLNIVVPRPGIRHCLLGFNASKHKHLINHPPATARDVQHSLVILERELLRIGIRTNLYSAPIRRLEVCTDIEVDAPLEAYWESLANCRPPSRMKMRQYSHGITWANTRAALKVYGKYYQLRRHFGPKAEEMHLPPENTIRFETVALSPAAMRKKIGSYSMGEVNELSKASIDWHVNMGGGLFNG